VRARRPVAVQARAADGQGGRVRAHGAAGQGRLFGSVASLRLRAAHGRGR
jgi:hypothetical protein